MPFDVQPIGFHAHDIARVEAGLIIPRPDYTGGAAEEERGAAIEVEATMLIPDNATTPSDAGAP